MDAQMTFLLSEGRTANLWIDEMIAAGLATRIPLRYIIIAGNTDRARERLEEQLGSLADTYLGLVPDPCRYIIRPMLEPQYLGTIAGFKIYFYENQFYGNRSDDAVAAPLELYREFDDRSRLLPYKHTQCTSPEEFRTLLGYSWYIAGARMPFVLAIKP